MSVPTPKSLPTSGLELRSLIKRSGVLELSLARVAIVPPAADEVIVRVEATPINPSDLGLLLGPADPASAVASGTPVNPVTTFPLNERLINAMTARLDQSMAVVNEGAGVVVAAGSGAQHLLGKTVAVIGGNLYAEYRRAKLAECIPLPPGITPAQGASVFVNPMTALSMVDNMRRDGHKGLVHTAAASNLGQMLNRVCLKDGVDLVCIVRSQAQAALLREQGAKFVCDSSSPDFAAELTAALVTTGATLAFDAIGGGELATTILSCMEAAANQTAKEYSRYGSNTYKQLFIYGALDMGPTVLKRNFGFSFGVGGWLLWPYLQKIGPTSVMALQKRVLDEITTTFASHYSAEISLRDVLDPAMIARYGRRATGEKFLINPAR